MAKSKLDEKWDTLKDNPLIMVSELETVWNKDIAEYMDDEDFGKVLDIAAKIIGGDMPEAAKVATVCVKLEAYAIKFRVLYSSYMGFEKGTTNANLKKNMYKELYTGVDRLVDALKYLAR